MYRADVLQDQGAEQQGDGLDITRVSFHVWVIPLICRIFVPRFIRRRPGKHLPSWLRVRLLRFTRYRFEYQGTTGVERYRRGVGLVGRCVDANDPTVIHISDLDDEEFQAGLVSPDAWRNSKPEINKGLKLAQAEDLAKRYQQAAALVLQRRGAPIGCITMELPKDCDARFPDPSDVAAVKNDPLLKALREAASLTEIHLTPSL